MNTDLTESCRSKRISRRTLLRSAGLLTAGLAAGCTPVRMLLDRHPAEFGGDSASDQVLWAFVDTVAPGGPTRAPGAIRAFSDPAYPFATYRDFFADDLCRRSKTRYGVRGFGSLEVSQRARVVEDGLHGDAIARRLYEGAIFLAQLSVYGGICNDAEATPAIRFDGANDGYPREAITYPDPKAFLSEESTFDGNPA